MGREAYHRELRNLENEVHDMASMVRTALADSVAALVARDFERSREIVKNDIVINDKRYGIEDRCLLLIATQQPMAGDLRIIAAILSIITDLERIADHAEGTASINLLIGDRALVKPLDRIPQMADIALDMFDRCMDAFRNRDIAAARVVCDDDDKVDNLYDALYRELIELMIANRDVIEGATYLTWVAHNLERVADRITNIAERVVFMATGRIQELNVSKY